MCGLLLELRAPARRSRQVDLLLEMRGLQARRVERRVLEALNGVVERRALDGDAADLTDQSAELFGRGVLAVVGTGLAADRFPP